MAMITGRTSWRERRAKKFLPSGEKNVEYGSNRITFACDNITITKARQMRTARNNGVPKNRFDSRAYKE